MALLLGALGALLARATLLEVLAPFHLALLAAVAVRMPNLWLWPAVAAAATRALTAGWEVALPDLGAGVVMGVAIRLLPPGASGDDQAAVRAGGLAAIAVLLGHGTAALVEGLSTFSLITLVFRLLITALLAVLFTHAVSAAQRRWWRSLHAARFGRESGMDVDLPAGVAVAGSGRNAVPTRDEWLSGAVVLAALIAGLQGLTLGPLSLDLAVAALFVMAAARWGGAGAGAATGAAIAGIAVLNGMLDPVTIGIQAAAGLLAGLLSDHGPVGSASGYVLAYLL
ncbi:MAG TPA: hypothetical protein VIL95_07930, partial [Bacillota bacterium]